MISLTPSFTRITRIVFVLGVVCLATNFAATHQSFVVTSTNNDGPGSLREAITNVNATLGADTIIFNIPGPGFNNVLGGTQSGAANKIAFNGDAGVVVFAGTRNSLRGNSIFSNVGLGIDLHGNGVTANDAADSDIGANNLQNFPVLTSVMSSGNSTTIQGSLNSTPNTTFQIDFYSNAAVDLSINREGALFFNTTSVTTDSGGTATINVTFPLPLETGRVLTATATDPAGNTLEFSAGDVASAAGNVQFSVSSIRVIEDIGLATITVLRKGGSLGSLTVDYATMDGTATAGQDYTSTSGSLTFSNGETTKTLQIPVLDDAVTEPDETFTVVLRASNLETLGTPATLVVTLQDRSTVPAISVNAVSVVEGNTGTTTEALFTFTLSAATGRPVSVNYATQDSNAFGSQSCSNLGTDYETVSGTLSFPPGTTSVNVPIKVCGDNSAEATERFTFNLTSPVNAIVDFPLALGTIRDDDFLELLHEDSGPTAALDAVLMLSDPFPVKLPEWFTMTGPDRNTRVMIFVRGLQLNPGEFPSAVQVLIFDENNLSFPTFAEDVRAVPNTDFTQVVFRLQNDLHAGTYTVAVLVHFRTSNTGTIRIAP